MQRDVAGASVQVGLDASPDVIDGSPRHDGVDEPVTAARHEVVVGEAQARRLFW